IWYNLAAPRASLPFFDRYVDMDYAKGGRRNCSSLVTRIVFPEFGRYSILPVKMVFLEMRG
ncbi:hypothetical protein Moror_5368, partial [Moniliophthora roreri MCA 2997]